jgi:hypothetical protein
MAKETSSSSVLETKFMYKLRSTKLLLRNPPFQVIITIIIISPWIDQIRIALPFCHAAAPS